MADAIAIAGLLDRASRVFLLANHLGREFKQDFDSQGPVFMVGDESPRQRRRAKIDEFIDAVLDLSDAVKHPPDGFAAVAVQLRFAGRIAKRLSNPSDGDILGLFPDLNSLAYDGYQTVKAARKAVLPDDPFAVFDEPKVSESSAVVEATATTPTLEEIRARIQSTREQLRHPNASHVPNRDACDAYNDYATIVRMLDKFGIKGPPLPDHRLHPNQTIAYVLQALDDVELALNRAAAKIEEAAATYIEDKFSGSGAMLEAVTARLINPPDLSDAFANVVESAYREDESVDTKTNAKPKRRGRRKADYATVQREAKTRFRIIHSESRANYSEKKTSSRKTAPRAAKRSD